MRIETPRFGEIEVPQERVLEFPEGLVGFPGLTRFLMVDDENTAPFMWLQSLDETHLAYVAVDPQWVSPDYRIDLMPAMAGQLGIQAEEEMGILLLVTIPEDPREMTANLKGPLVFNSQTRQGTQLILEDDRFPLQFRLISEATPAP